MLNLNKRAINYLNQFTHVSSVEDRKAYALIVTLLSLSFAVIYISAIIFIGVSLIESLLLFMLIINNFLISASAVIAILAIIFVLFVGYWKLREAQENFLKKHKEHLLYPFIYWVLIAIPVAYFLFSGIEENWTNAILAAVLGLLFNAIYEIRRANS